MRFELQLSATLAAGLAAASCTSDYQPFQTAPGSTTSGGGAAAASSSTGNATSSGSASSSGGGVGGMGTGGIGGGASTGAGAGTPGMVLIPAGPFMMGCAPADNACDSDESPQHAVNVSAFEIDATEVTQAAYQACVEVGVCTTPLCAWDPVTLPLHPATCVRWGYAGDYCAWVGKRLPTEAEWEKAARGDDARIYPWGAMNPDCFLAHFGSVCGAGTTLVANHLAGDGPYGLHDMAGNAWEWVADWYDPNYYTTSPAADPQGPAAGGARVLRGGDFDSPSNHIRTSKRATNDPMNPQYSDGVGFRCAK